MSLKLVPPADPSPVEKVRQRVKAMPKPASLIQCPRCGGREMIETKTSIEWVEGKTRGGKKALLCVACLLSGSRVQVG